MTSDDTSQRIRDVLARIQAGRQTPEYGAGLAKHEAELADYERAEAESLKHKAWRKAGIPELFLPDLATPKPTDALTRVKVFMSAPARFLILGGPRGVGKSFAAAWAVTIGGGMFLPGRKLKFTTYDSDFWDDISRQPVVALDDLGTEQTDAGGWLEGNWIDFVNVRENSGRKTVITTNLTGPEFKQRYGTGAMERALDRLKGSFVALKGESLRQREPGEEG